MPHVLQVFVPLDSNITLADLSRDFVLGLPGGLLTLEAELNQSLYIQGPPTLFYLAMDILEIHIQHGCRYV